MTPVSTAPFWPASQFTVCTSRLSGMFRRNASLAIPHRKSFAAIPSVSLVLLAHTNHNVSLSPESKREIALVEALSRPIPYSILPTSKSGGRKTGLCFARFVVLTFRGPLASHDSNPYPNLSRIARYNTTKLHNLRAFDSFLFKEASALFLQGFPFFPKHFRARQESKILV